MGDSRFGASHTLDDVSGILLKPVKEIVIQFSLKLVSTGPIDNKQALVQKMDWCRTGDKQLCEPMMAHFADTYMSLALDDLNTYYFDSSVMLNQGSLVITVDHWRISHDDAMTWKYFPRSDWLCEGNWQATSGFPS